MPVSESDSYALLFLFHYSRHVHKFVSSHCRPVQASVHCVQCSLWGTTEVWGTTLLEVRNSTVCCMIQHTVLLRINCTVAIAYGDHAWPIKCVTVCGDWWLTGPNWNTGDFIFQVASFWVAGDWDWNTGAPVKYRISDWCLVIPLTHKPSMLSELHCLWSQSCLVTAASVKAQICHTRRRRAYTAE